MKTRHSIGQTNAGLNDTQLELELSHIRRQRSPSTCRSRRARAQWWFQRMRAVVDRALDFQPAPEPKPEQTCLEGIYRANELAPIKV